MEDMIEHIQKVNAYMLKRYIKANTIIIDSDVAKVNGFQYLASPQTIADVPTMFLGLKVEYENNLSEKIGIPVNFIMTERKIPETPIPKTPLSEYSIDELLDEIRKRSE